jgi:predicted nucleotidyltransferase
MDIRKAADRLRRKYKVEEEDLGKRRKHACKSTFETVSVLAAEDPDLKQVFGFGSVFEGLRRFRNDSDIDLAIVMLRAELRQDLNFIELNYRKNREMSLRIEKIGSDDEYQFATLG